jgi:hypothetical protein
MQTQQFNDFKKEILKLDKPRKHTITNSYGVYDAYKYIRKNKWFNIGRPLSEHEFYTMIRLINQELASTLINTGSVKFPLGMGELLVTKGKGNVKFKDGKLVNTYPINWNETLKLWCEDPESKKNKTLIRQRNEEIFKVIYRKSKSIYINSSVFNFRIARCIKEKLKEAILNTNYDALI